VSLGPWLKLQVEADAFRAACERAVEAIDRLVAARLGVWPRPLSAPGAIVYRAALRLGFCSVDVLAWLETCPGAFADEFGDGWER